MAGPVRLKYENFVSKLSTDQADVLYGIYATLLASSEAVGLPVTNLRDQGPGKRWRSRTGWAVSSTSGVANYRINFTEAGVGRLASVAVGVYTTGAALATALQTAMNAAAVSNTYTVTYSTSTRKFTFTRATGAAAFAVQWTTGANAFEGIGPCIGFVADDTGSTAYTSDNATRTSRHFARLDVGTGRLVTYGEIIGHNLSASGVIRLQADNNSDFSSPSTNAALSPSVNGLGRLTYSINENKQFYRLVVDDIDNILGYGEVGVWAVGGYVQTTRRMAHAFSKRLQHLSSVTFAMDGALHTDQRTSKWAFDVNWSALSDAERLVLEALFAAAPFGKAFFVDMDSDVLDSWYVILTEQQGLDFVGRANWNSETPLVQVVA